MKKIYFGCAGIPLSTKNPTSPNGVRRVRELDLDVMELEFVRGVRMSDTLAEDVRRRAEENRVHLTAHGPYWINLASLKLDVRRSSVERILRTARAGWKCGARSITFHAGYYYKDDVGKTLELVKKGLTEVLSVLEDEGNDIRVCPELMGKAKSFGKLDELLEICDELEGLHPCIDFAHLHAYKGEYNSYDEFSTVLGLIEDRLGSGELRDMHMHISGVQYGEKGEQKHLELDDSDLNYRDLIRALCDFDCRGVAISESPNIEDDAILMKNLYDELRY